jgi:hypothetical protein
MAKKPTYDPRKLMEEAVEVMKASVREQRSDDTTTPKVGAVLSRQAARQNGERRGLIGWESRSLAIPRAKMARDTVRNGRMNVINEA